MHEYLELPMKYVVGIFRAITLEENIDTTVIDLPVLLKYLATCQILSEK